MEERIKERHLKKRKNKEAEQARNKKQNKETEERKNR